MRIHNMCFHGEPEKYQQFSDGKVSYLVLYVILSILSVQWTQHFFFISEKRHKFTDF